MKSTASSDPIIEEQASLWAARLDGGALTSSQRTELRAWLDADPARRLLLSAYCQFSADLEQQLPLLAGIKDEVAEITTAHKIAPLLPWLRWPTLAGASLIAAAALAVILWKGHPQDTFQNLATPIAQRQALTLADGTQVELNAQTVLAVELTARERRVRLAGGEVFFHVAKDSARPFFVETAAGSVRVTGTQFNVRTAPAGQLEVTVVEGAVQVRPGDQADVRALHAGEQLVRAGGRVTVHTLAAADVNRALAWRAGQVIFNGTPLREALTAFARYHGRTLTASDAAAMQRVSARYSLDDLDGFLAELEAAMPLRVTHESDGSIRVDAVRN
jgi:transmembrane sensor